MPFYSSHRIPNLDYISKLLLFLIYLVTSVLLNVCVVLFFAETKCVCSWLAMQEGWLVPVLWVLRKVTSKNHLHDPQSKSVLWPRIRSFVSVSWWCFFFCFEEERTSFHMIWKFLKSSGTKDWHCFFVQELGVTRN